MASRKVVQRVVSSAAPNAGLQGCWSALSGSLRYEYTSCSFSPQQEQRLNRSYCSASAYRQSPSKPSSPFASLSNSPFDADKTKVKKRQRRKFIPRKAAVALTPKAREFFQSLLEGVTSTHDSKPQSKEEKDPVIGIQLTYTQSTSGEPRMVFGFSFLRASTLHPNDEAVSLELLDDGSPKLPADAMEDGLPKLYVHRDAVLKVLGATLDVDEKKLLPILYDKEGNVMDPNA
mmetsp:Transcript_15358/g.33193  ORF Transcript_15358/g.33193 Transcript_15358/m.33193 type:complete len:232 (+) Transcript_15358:119-814(+)